jgi:putative peptidoglycan lipid II flippase
VTVAGGRGASIGRAGAVLAAGTLVSRVLGFVNAAVLSWAIGVQNTGASAFSVANTLPTNLFLLISGGLLSAVLVPQIVRAAHHDDGGSRYVSRLLTLAGTVFIVVTIVATVAAPALVTLYGNAGRTGQLGPAGFDLAIAFAYWCLPQILFYALYSLLGEVLNARGVFGPVTWVPAINNVVIIVAAIVFVNVYGADPAHVDVSTWGPGEIALIGGSATLGIALQTVGLILFWPKTGLRFRPDFHWRGVGLGGAGRAAAWTFGMLVISQIGAIVQNQVSLVPVSGDPSTRSVQLAWQLFILPHSIVTMSLAAPYFTRMSGHARDGRLADVRADLSESLRTVGLIIAGAGAAVACAALPFAAILTRTTHEAVGVGSVLLAYLIGLVPFSMLFLAQRTFFALGDTRTPFFIQIAQTGVFIVGAVIASTQPSPVIAVGIALSTSISEFVQLFITLLVLRRRLGGLDGRRVLRRVGTFAAATIPAAAVGVLALWALGGIPGAGAGFAFSGKEAAVLSVVTVGAVAMLVYLGVLALLRVPELRAATRVVTRFLPGR